MFYLKMSEGIRRGLGSTPYGEFSSDLRKLYEDENIRKIFKFIREMKEVYYPDICRKMENLSKEEIDRYLNFLEG